MQINKTQRAVDQESKKMNKRSVHRRVMRKHAAETKKVK